jgi:predicted GH43/DUF377 family glycosyl hydrolase
MPWRQCGVIYQTDGSRSWSRTHTQLPTAIEIDGVIRVYYATRDQNNRSRTSFIEVDRTNPAQVLHLHDKPVLDLGDPGTHDEDGVLASHVIRIGDDFLMYYGGVSRGGNVSYRMSIGLARSRDGGLTFHREFKGPVVDRTPEEPFMTMAPHVRRNGSHWIMWYGSGVGWVDVQGKYEPIYVVKVAHSDDGVRWHQGNHTCIQPLHEQEANTRPSVLPTEHGFEMWFCYRNSRDFRDGAGSYRIGYAVSIDGQTWVRKEDPAELEPTGEGWNSAAMSYPNVIAVAGKRIMFHNGDGFGRSGFGYSVWSDSPQGAQGHF